MDLGYFATQSLIEEIARELYRMQGYNYNSDVSMADSPHPTERLMHAMAKKAVEMTLAVVKELENEK
ncbi:MAG: hypothetical protein JO235_16425 [Chroococcidiopsidaceae cyanobacterium CP_BM_RX_35]|nr:hypothetical protein [Chroococcidiopsidaceae cyanobacterium CP_BM_RX_35]